MKCYDCNKEACAEERGVYYCKEHYLSEQARLQKITDEFVKKMMTPTPAEFYVTLALLVFIIVLTALALKVV